LSPLSQYIRVFLFLFSFLSEYPSTPSSFVPFHHSYYKLLVRFKNIWKASSNSTPEVSTIAMSVTISSEGRLKVQQLMTVSPSPTPLNTAASSPVEKGPTEKDDVFPPIRLPPHRGVGKLEFQSTDFPVATVKDKYRYLALYFTLNLVLTLYNKAIMGVVNFLSYLCSGVWLLPESRF
jgi:hypothetical protein